MRKKRQDFIRAEIDLNRRNGLLDEMNAAYERLRTDPGAWAQEVAEREAWEGTVADGVT